MATPKRSSSVIKRPSAGSAEGPKIKRKNALLWLLEPFEADPEYSRRRLFGFDAAYLDDRIYVAVRDGSPPWEGVLICTSREHHASLLAQFPQLTAHPIIGKWLHLSALHPEFESMAQEIIRLALDRDERLGVASHLRRRRVRS